MRAVGSVYIGFRRNKSSLKAGDGGRIIGIAGGGTEKR